MTDFSDEYLIGKQVKVFKTDKYPKTGFVIDIDEKFLYLAENSQKEISIAIAFPSIDSIEFLDIKQKKLKSEKNDKLL